MTLEQANERIAAELDREWPDWRSPGNANEWLGIELFERNGRFDYQIDASRGKLDLGIEVVRRALGDRIGEKMN
jgi:hypothetical protein